jgi:hypothetical protein
MIEHAQFDALNDFFGKIGELNRGCEAREIARGVFE